jgi:hydroxyacylglutathione hydrolase
MLQVKHFTFNLFQENTYILYDENTRDGCIIDAGNSQSKEDAILLGFIEKENIKINRLLNTHAHIDHILGNKKVADELGLTPELHAADLYTFDNTIRTAQIFGFSLDDSPKPRLSLSEGDKIQIGASAVEVIFTPGHSKGSVSFYCPEHGFIISGDVIFNESIGRTDLQGGNYQELIETISSKIYSLPPQTIIYSGHGPQTSVAYEMRHNPFVKA